MKDLIRKYRENKLSREDLRILRYKLQSVPPEDLNKAVLEDWENYPAVNKKASPENSIFLFPREKASASYEIEDDPLSITVTDTSALANRTRMKTYWHGTRKNSVLTMKIYTL